MRLILIPNLLAQVFVKRIEKIVTTRSSFSSSLRMQGATHFEFSETIWKTNSRTSLLTRSRPIVSAPQFILGTNRNAGKRGHGDLGSRLIACCRITSDRARILEALRA